MIDPTTIPPVASTTAATATSAHRSVSELATRWLMVTRATIGPRSDFSRPDLSLARPYTWPVDLAIVFLGTSGSVPTARRGHAAPAPPLDGGPRRAPRRRPDALPRRPLSRPAGDAEDLRAPRARGAPHRLRATRPCRPLHGLEADLRKADVRGRSARVAPGRRKRSRRLPDLRLRGRARRRLERLLPRRESPARAFRRPDRPLPRRPRGAALRTPAGRRGG